VTAWLRIDRVELRLRGSSPRSARALAAELRAALRPALEAELRRRPPAAGAERVARLEAPVVRAQRDAPAQQTAAAVGRAVAEGLASRRPGR
jgi:hypothetical protein